MINRTTIRTAITGSVVTAALAAMAISATSAAAADGAGLRNCVDITGKQFNQVGCYEKVWSGGTEYRMTFSNLSFSGSAPKDLDAFYVTAPQRAEAQGYSPAFLHDHTVRDIPADNAGTYTTKLQGFFVLCSGQGLVSGACVPLWTSPAGPALPFAATVNGAHLTSTGAIEAAAADGDVVLVNLGPSAVIVGSISAIH